VVGILIIVTVIVLSGGLGVAGVTAAGGSVGGGGVGGGVGVAGVTAGSVGGVGGGVAGVSISVGGGVGGMGLGTYGGTGVGLALAGQVIFGGGGGIGTTANPTTSTTSPQECNNTEKSDQNEAKDNTLDTKQEQSGNVLFFVFIFPGDTKLYCRQSHRKFECEIRKRWSRPRYATNKTIEIRLR
jgi:hypothetical protein